MIRPKTTFGKKNDNVHLADIKDLDNILESFYEEDYNKKVTAARMILYISLDQSKMVDLAKEILFNIVSRSLKEDHKRNMEFTIHMLCFFYGYSCYETFHEILSSYGIGEACIGIVNFQYSKYTIRKESLVKKSQENHPDLQKELEKFLFMIRKQDRILILSFKILLNLADNMKVEKKMVKDDIVGWLIKNIERSNINLIVVVLLFIKKLSVVDVNKNNLIKNNIQNLLLVNCANHLVKSLSLEIVYNLSFDQKFVNKIIQKPEVFKSIIDSFKVQSLRGLVLKILFNLSKDPSAKPLFADTDCMYIVFELLIKFPEPKIGVELAALTLNLTTYNKNSEILASEDKIKALMARAFKTNDIYLVKIIKNIIKYSEVEELNELFENFVDQFIDTLQNKSPDDEFSSEIIEILSSIETNWEDKLENFGLIEFIESNLQSSSNPEILLKLVLFIGNIANSSVRF